MDSFNFIVNILDASVIQTEFKIDDAKKYLNEAVNIDETFTIADQKLSMLEKYDIKNFELEIQKTIIAPFELH